MMERGRRSGASHDRRDVCHAYHCCGRTGSPMGVLTGRQVFIIAACVFLCGSVTPAAQNSNDTPYAASRLIGRWRTIMNRTLEDTRASAAEEVADLMEGFVSPGAVRAVQDKATEAQLKNA